MTFLIIILKVIFNTLIRYNLLNDTKLLVWDMCENRCDRILWKGEGLNQMCYVRGESKFSDHRPVYSLFSVQVDMKSKNIAPSTATMPRCCPLKPLTNSSLSSTCCTAKVQAEEQLLLLTRAQSCIDTVPRFWVHKTHTRQR